MARKIVQVKQTQTSPGIARALVRAYLGAWGVAGDHVNRIIHLERLWNILVRRGERIENRAAAFVKRGRARARAAVPHSNK